MKWTTTITDLHRHAGSGQHYVLAAADDGSGFSASATFAVDLKSNQSRPRIDIPLTPSGWVSMALACAGADVVLTGGEYAHHTWNKGALLEHPAMVAWRSGHLWRASDDIAYYCGDTDTVTVVRHDAIEHERPAPSAKLTCIHGLHPGLRIAGGHDGVLFIDRGTGWAQVDDVPTLSTIVDVCCVSSNEIYVCAGTGGVFKWDGASDWTQFDVDPDAFMYSLCRYKGRVCVASLNLKSYWLTDKGAIPIPESIVAIRFKTDGDLLFGLGLGRFEVFDGTTWRIHELDLYKLFPKELEAIRAAAPGP